MPYSLLPTPYSLLPTPFAKVLMPILKSSFFWFFCFTVIFLLSQDFWSWQQDISFSLLHLPPWVFYFIALQILLAVALLLFVVNFWETSSKEDR
ncbi:MULTISPECIES: hypothetical protein [Moorena]|nr:MULTISPECIES: hypothetical protein [Moorena]